MVADPGRGGTDTELTEGTAHVEVDPFVSAPFPPDHGYPPHPADVPDLPAVPAAVDLPDLPPPPADVPAHLAADLPEDPGHGQYLNQVRADDRAVSTIDVEAELRLLAAVFTNAALLDELDTKVAADDFGVVAHELVFAAMQACDASGRTVDVVTVADELTRRGAIKQAGGIDNLRRIVPSEHHHLDQLARWGR